jgi:uncharacterized protein YndB with AHSA1/START domain
MTREMRMCIDLDTTPERVWEVLTDVSGYPAWTPVMTSAEGTFAVGGRVVFGFPPLHPLLRSRVPATVLEVTPLRRLRYVLRFARLGVPGMLDSEQTATIDLSDGSGRVRLWLQLWVGGLLVPLIVRSLSPDEAPTFEALSAALRARIEGSEPTSPDGTPHP